MVDFQSDYQNYLQNNPYEGQAREASESTQTTLPQFSQDIQAFSQPDPTGFDTVIDQAASEASKATQKANAEALKAQEAFVKEQEQEMMEAIEAYRSQGLDVTPEEISLSVPTIKGETIGETQKGILSEKGVITQRFGNRNAIEKFSGGVNYGTDIGVKRGTKVALPPGEWQVIEAYNKATVDAPRNSQAAINRGYGNSVLVQNTQTGEKMRFSHLAKGQVFAQPGQTLKGGTVVGKVGTTGNTTGPHLDWEVYDSRGKLVDGLKTQYARYLLGT